MVCGIDDPCGSGFLFVGLRLVCVWGICLKFCFLLLVRCFFCLI